jgi:hypothetical protein
VGAGIRRREQRLLRRRRRGGRLHLRVAPAPATTRRAVARAASAPYPFARRETRRAGGRDPSSDSGSLSLPCSSGCVREGGRDGCVWASALVAYWQAERRGIQCRRAVRALAPCPFPVRAAGQDPSSGCVRAGRALWDPAPTSSTGSGSLSLPCSSGSSADEQ